MATISLNTTDATQDARIANAVGKRAGLVDAQGVRRSATGAEVKKYIIDQMKLTVDEVEAEDRRDAVKNNPSGVLGVS